MAHQKLTPEVLDVLTRSAITRNNLVLPTGQLDRKLYEAVNKALTNAGGKWNRSAQAHVFTGDPRKKLGLMIDTGVAVDEKKQFQAFFTPAGLAARVALLASVHGHAVMEPSAGEGALADACRISGAKRVNCVELNPESAAKLRAKGYEVIEGDFLSLKAEPQFDRVVMNPPFTKDQDVAHVRTALMWLKPGGMLVAIMGGNKERSRFKGLIHGLDATIEDVPHGAFKESGTNVATIVVTIRI